MSTSESHPALHDLGVAGLARELAAGHVSSVEATRHLLARAADHAALGAFLQLDAEGALAAARAADAVRARGQAGRLTGVPVAHKDIFVTRGGPSTAGSRMLQGYRSPFDATVVARLGAGERAASGGHDTLGNTGSGTLSNTSNDDAIAVPGAGMVSLGKLNCDEFAMGSGNENSAYGAVRNPWDTARVPGGSSGGSAAAVAAGLVPAATGTDTGGSIRQPASFCGITGIKPTYGTCSRYGMIAFASSLDQAGPLARSAEDCALLLSAMSGFDARDSTSAQRPPQDFHAQMLQPRAGAAAGRPLQGLRIGVPREFFPATLSAAVGDTVRAALTELERLGATLVDVSLPRTELSIPVYYIIAPAEASSNLSRFDGVRYGHRAAHYRDLQELYKASRSEGFGPEVKRRIMIGTYVLSHGYYDAYYLQAQKLRRMIADDFRQCFGQCDLIAGPVAPTVAWKLGEQGDDPVRTYLADIFTLPASLAGLPGMSLPAGFAHTDHPSGLPVGLQLIGNYFDEGRLLHAAHAFQAATDFHLRRPAPLGKETA
jgi:aspartyl-tRNA(Asn)/glutamyl-tRNA(Gln) amidotransferase subunit A